MPKNKYKVELSAEEMELLKEITHKGRSHTAKTIMHANILLNTNDKNPAKKTDREISEIFGVSKTTVNDIRKTYAEQGLESALERKSRISPPIMSKITGDFEAQMIASALSPPPLGRCNG